jgi:hypothetical protein
MCEQTTLILFYSCAGLLFINGTLLFYWVRAHRILAVMHREERFLRHLGVVEYMRQRTRRTEPIVDVNAFWWSELSWSQKQCRWVKFYVLWYLNWLFGFCSYDAVTGRLSFKP